MTAKRAETELTTIAPRADVEVAEKKKTESETTKVEPKPEVKE